MNINPDEDWKEISPEQFKALLEGINWKGDAFANCQVYFYVHNGQRFAWESADRKQVFVDPKLLPQTPKNCPKCKTPFPMPIWRMRVEESPRFVSVCPRCRTEQPVEPDKSANERLRYQLVNDLLETDPPEDPTVEYATTQAEEPESVKAFRLMVEGTDDKAAATRIWYEFRYAIKKQTQIGKAVSWQDINNLIDAGIKRARKQLKTREMRLAVIGRFQVMQKRVQEFITNPELDASAKCPKCNLSTFICPCVKE